LINQHRNLINAIKTVTVPLSHGKWHVLLVQKVECKTAKEVLSSIVGYDINREYIAVVCIVVFDNLNVKGIQAFYGPMVNDNVMGMITHIIQYPVTLNSGIYCVCKHKNKLDLTDCSFACNKCGFESCRGLSAA
jgi:hypothetical protein